MQNEQHDVTEALGEQPVGGLHEGLEARLAKDAKDYYVEYGARVDDGDMLFHFYASKDHYLRTQTGHLTYDEWEGMPVDIKKVFEEALLGSFAEKDIEANYIPEIQSYCFRIAGLGLSLDPEPQVNAFFERIDAGLA